MNERNPIHPERIPEVEETTRRYFLRQSGMGLGSLALTALLNESVFAAPVDDPLALKPPMFPAKAKRIVFLHMAGAPSQLDLFDPKPTLTKYNGKECPEEYLKGEQFAFIRGTPKLLGTPYQFAQHGQSGSVVSELMPHLSEIVDDVAIIRSMHTDQFNHAPAQLFMLNGWFQPGRPSMGAWLSYGLGSMNRDLPAYVVLTSVKQPDGGKSCWSSGFLPTIYQGVEFRSQGDPVLFVSNPDGVPHNVREESIAAINDLNRMSLQECGDPEILTRIGQFEMAYRMQSSVPDLMDVSQEPQSIHEMYGTQPGKASFANNCLLARRLLERGVRMVQLHHWGWDSHGTGEGDDLLHALPKRCEETDRPVAALVKDLKRRGMLEDTLVVWGGEFGRTPMNEARNGSTYLGRDHHPHAFTMWMAGGGVKPGITLGETDDLGYYVTKDPVHVHDLHATILHLMGIEHTKLTYRFQGRDFRLTDVFGNLVPQLIA
ncbi:MAG: DUF1501 domain-containing protein [bacterium]|nr:DUF1501 domain-containing protein [bacterium]